MLRYCATLIASVTTGILIFPYSIIHIFFSYRGEGVISSLTNIRMAIIKMVYSFKLINSEIFNNNGIILLLILFMICLSWILKHKKKIHKKIEDTGIIYIVLPMIVYLTIAIVGSPYVDIRYIMPAVPLIFCVTIYIIKDLMVDIIDSKKVFAILILICILFSITVIPKMSNNIFTYKGYADILKYAENQLYTNPFIYVYEHRTAQYNKIMGCYYILTKVNESYVMNINDFNAKKLERVIELKDISKGITVMMEDVEKDRVLNEIIKNGLFTHNKYIGRMGRFLLYELK